ncbi:MAG: glycosyltransferase family 2 protein [Paracoccus sp. (in: a-proteobacteria)]|nr:glycosyltransferase family 2 protein [Paracoccus sp. (in: a-proteobacteria)]
MILSATTARNEGPYLLEWIAWHRMLGVTDFLFYSNDCDDGSDLLLDRLAAHDVIRHERHRPPPGRSIQWSALKSAWQHEMRKRADWMLISDIDEFPVVHAGAGRFDDLLAALPQGADAVALPWRLFGAGGLDEITDAPVTGLLTRSAPEGLAYPIAATFFKSLVRPAAFSGPGVHRPRHRKDERPLWADGAGRVLPMDVACNDKRLSLIGLPPHRALVEMNHYSLRSAQAFLVKSERGLPNRADKAIDLSYWTERNFNHTPNDAALRRQPALLDAIAALRALPGIADLHDACLRWHQEQAARIIATPEGYQLYSRIMLAGDSLVLPAATQKRLLRLFGQIQRPD